MAEAPNFSVIIPRPYSNKLNDRSFILPASPAEDLRGSAEFFLIFMRQSRIKIKKNSADP